MLNVKMNYGPSFRFRNHCRSAVLWIVIDRKTKRY